MRQLQTCILAVVLFAAFGQAPAVAGLSCGGSSPECGGSCPPGLACISVGLGTGGATTSIIDGCACLPILVEPCGFFPSCGGECPDGFECLSDFVDDATTQAPGAPCFCQPDIIEPEFCGTAPQCGGSCEPGSTCRDGSFFAEGAKGAASSGAATQGDINPCFCIPDTPPGACCLPDSTCTELMAEDCTESGGAFLGEGSSCAEAQCSDPGTFTTSTCATPFEDISGSGVPLILTDDDGEIVPLGFSFAFFSNTHSQVGVSSNGYLSFGSDLTDFTPDPIPDPNDPNAYIAPFWDDFHPGNGGTVQYQTLGSAPNRRFVAQWTDVPEYVADGSNTFQVLVFEGSNAIDFRYGPFDSSFGVVGVENAVGNAGQSVPFGSVAPGVCLRLTPGTAAVASPAPALDGKALAALVLTLAAIALIAIRRVGSSAR